MPESLKGLSGLSGHANATSQRTAQRLGATVPRPPWHDNAKEIAAHCCGPGRLACHHRQMLKTLKDLFDALMPPAPDSDPRTEEQALQLATAVMLVEVMRADAQVRPAERQAVLAALRSQFALGADATARLQELAEQTAKEATDLFGFTERINQHFDMPQKLRMIEQMWGVAYADGHLSAHERHVLWRIADLLYVPHGAYVHARLRAQKAAGIEGDAALGGDTAFAGGS